MAQRSGRMKFITMTPVYEGEIREWNRFTETYTPGERLSENIVGYFASFELLNGFKKASYWTRDEVIKHAKRFSKAFNSGPWQTDFDAMACKTVLLSIMKTYAPLSIEMQSALEMDGKVSVLSETGDEEFIDIDTIDDAEPPAAEATADGRKVDAETGELFEK